MRRQIVSIGGGDVFRTYKEYISFLKKFKLDFKKTKKWRENLPKKLGKNFEVINLKMPNTFNARYEEWKIMFEKIFPFLKNNVILLGHSLGGIFLAKYLSKNKFPKKIKGTFLVSAPFDEENTEYSLEDFKLPKKLDKFRIQGGKIFLYHSKDDKIVSFIDFEKYKKALPKSKAVEFKNRGHFDQASFSELVKDIKGLK